MRARGVHVPRSIAMRQVCGSELWSANVLRLWRLHLAAGVKHLHVPPKSVLRSGVRRVNCMSGRNALESSFREVLDSIAAPCHRSANIMERCGDNASRPIRLHWLVLLLSQCTLSSSSRCLRTSRFAAIWRGWRSKLPYGRVLVQAECRSPARPAKLEQVGVACMTV
jgi:hypothetical protein